MKRMMTAALAFAMVVGAAATANAQWGGRADNPELERGVGTPLQPGPGSVREYYYRGYGGYYGYGNRQIYDGTANHGNEPPNAAPGGRVNSHQQ